MGGRSRICPQVSEPRACPLNCHSSPPSPHSCVSFREVTPWMALTHRRHAVPPLHARRSLFQVVFQECAWTCLLCSPASLLPSCDWLYLCGLFTSSASRFLHVWETKQTWGVALHGSAVSSMRAGCLGLGLCTVAVTSDSEQCRVVSGLEHDPVTWKI